MAKKKSNKKPVVDEVAEEVESVPEEKEESVPEAKPQFKNNGEDVKVKLLDGKEFKWVTIKSGQTVSIPRSIALANNFEEL